MQAAFLIFNDSFACADNILMRLPFLGGSRHFARFYHSSMRFLDGLKGYLKTSHRYFRMPITCQLYLMRCAKDFGFGEVVADELHADGQAAATETCG
jgi:hypothetical protein